MSGLKEFLYDWSGLNLWLFRQINSINGHYYDLLMQKITLLGDKHLLPYYVGIIMSYAGLNLLYRILAKKAGKSHYLQMWIGIFLVMGTGLFASQITVSKTKEHFSYQRPYAVLPQSEVRQLEGQEAKEADRSFPSGHVAIITALIVALWPALGGKAYFLGVTTIFAVMWSRIALGVHFPADVLFSFLIICFEIIIIRYVIYEILRKMFGIRM